MEKDYIFARDTLPTLITSGVAIISIIMVYLSTTKDRRLRKTEILQSQLESFYYPFVLRMRQNSVLRKVFAEKYGEKFRILTCLLNKEKEFSENDLVVLNEIVKNDKELNKLILQNQTIFGEYLREDLARLSAHYTVFILACEHKIKGEAQIYENYLHPNLVYGKILNEIKRIEQEIAIPYRFLRNIIKFFNSIKPQKRLAKKYWENIYSHKSYKESSYDGWLDKYMAQLKKAKTIIDLGCGDGVNAQYLHKKGIDVIACDFSESALKQIKKRNANIETMCFDMKKKIPFKRATVDIMIADLSLHYFTLKKTKKIIKNIFRLLNKNGVLLCRVNSIEEYHWADADIMIEPGFYFNGNNYKRYFAKDDIDLLFSAHHILNVFEEKTEKYGDLKYVWEIVVRKN